MPGPNARPKGDVKKDHSGGSSVGVEIAAIDAAIQFNIPHAGLIRHPEVFKPYRLKNAN